jgi:hypothetical protein
MADNDKPTKVPNDEKNASQTSKRRETEMARFGVVPTEPPKKLNYEGKPKMETIDKGENPSETPLEKGVVPTPPPKVPPEKPPKKPEE